MRVGQPRLHCIEKPGGGYYQFRSSADPSDEPWVCSCKTTGTGQPEAVRHLEVKAKSAWRRVSNLAAMAGALVSSGPQDDTAALSLLYSARHWTGHDALRRRLEPYYDRDGVLSSLMNWDGLADDLAAGRITGDDNDLMVLRVAISLAGVAVPIKLSDLWRLDGAEARCVRERIDKLLQTDDDPA